MYDQTCSCHRLSVTTVRAVLGYSLVRTPDQSVVSTVILWRKTDIAGLRLHYQHVVSLYIARVVGMMDRGCLFEAILVMKLTCLVIRCQINALIYSDYRLYFVCLIFNG